MQQYTQTQYPIHIDPYCFTPTSHRLLRTHVYHRNYHAEVQENNQLGAQPSDTLNEQTVCCG